MSQDIYILAVLDGLSYAALLFLVALGMTLVFGVMNIVNMAHGSFYALGGYMAATLGLWASNHRWLRVRCADGNLLDAAHL